MAICIRVEGRISYLVGLSRKVEASDTGSLTSMASALHTKLLTLQSVGLAAFRFNNPNGVQTSAGDRARRDVACASAVHS